MGKDGDYLDGTKVYVSRKEKKRRLVMNSDSESAEFVITPRLEIVQAGNGVTSGKQNSVMEKGGGRRKYFTRGDAKRKLGDEGSKGKILESWPDRKSKEMGCDQSDSEDVSSGSGDSTGNQTDTTWEIGKNSTSLKRSHKIKGYAKAKVLDANFDRKRSIETSDDKFSRKKPKTVIMNFGGNNTEKSGEEDLIVDSSKNSVEVSKLPVPRAKHRDEDGSSERKFQWIPRTSSNADAVRWIEQSGDRELPKVLNTIYFDDVLAMDVGDGGSSRHNYIGVHDKSSASGVLKSSENVDDSENANTHSKGQSSTCSLKSSLTNKFNVPNHQFLSQADKKPKAIVKPLKSAGKVFSKDASKSDVFKMNHEDTSQKKNTKASNESRSVVKNKLREQIKNILFDAGWTIEFRPRRGRAYDDAVYVSPQGSGYWSITKAYDVYLRQCLTVHDDKERSGNQPESFAGRDDNCKEANSTFAVIPPEVLHVLKRNVVNKRRSKREIEDTKIKVKRGRKKKGAKEITKVKNLKVKGIRDDVGGKRAIKGKVSIRNSKKRGCALLVRDFNQDEGSEKSEYTPYIWKRTILSWMIDMEVVPAYGKVRYMNRRMTRALLDGRITRDGIQCSCCSKILTVSKFEIHAGSKLHQPYENICLEPSDISLLQCQIEAWEKQESRQQIVCDVDTEGNDPNDDTCAICGDGGDLICCDSCPSTFHLGCLGIEMLPTGDWHCSNCSCKFCGTVSHKENASKTLFNCSQCARKYHKDCVPVDDAVSALSNSFCNSFCGRSCRKVFKKLQKLTGVRNELEAGLYWSIVRRFENYSKSPYRMAHTVESNSKIAVAYAVMDECFMPIIDQRSGINLIHNVVYNCWSKFNRLDFSGFNTFILERGDEIVAAASVRIHDTKLAEMPFIGTRCMYRRQGMCRQLLQGIESTLRSLCVRKLIIPAISELMDTWTNVFGFIPVEMSHNHEIKSVNILVFPGTGLLQKSLLNDSTKEHTKREQVKQSETQISAEADKKYSFDVAMDSKDTKCNIDALKPNMAEMEQSFSNLLPEKTGERAKFCISSDNAADSESNYQKDNIYCNNHAEKDTSRTNYQNDVVACNNKVPKNELEDVIVALPSFQHPEGLHLASQNQCNLKLSAADLAESCHSEKEGGCSLDSLQKNLKGKPPISETAHSSEFIVADEDKVHQHDVLKLRRAANGLNSDVDEEDAARHLNNFSGMGSSASSRVCGNGLEAFCKHNDASTNEINCQKSELAQNQWKSCIEYNCPNQLAARDSAKSHDIEAIPKDYSVATDPSTSRMSELLQKQLHSCIEAKVSDRLAATDSDRNLHIEANPKHYSVATAQSTSQMPELLENQLKSCVEAHVSDRLAATDSDRKLHSAVTNGYDSQKSELFQKQLKLCIESNPSDVIDQFADCSSAKNADIEANPEHYGVAINESTSQKTELLQNQLKSPIEANDLDVVDWLAINDSARSPDVEATLKHYSLVTHESTSQKPELPKNQLNSCIEASNSTPFDQLAVSDSAPFESTSQKSDLLQNHLKSFIESNDSDLIDRLAVSDSVKSPDVECASCLVGTNSTTDGSISKPKVSTTSEVGDDCHDAACDVSIAGNDLGVVETGHGFDLPFFNHTSKMVT